MMEIALDAVSHWLKLELLSRYAETAQAGLDPKHIYPALHEHLAACEVCRSTLNYLLSSPDAPVSFFSESSRPPKWLTLPNKPADVRWAWRPNSQPTAFGLQVSLDARALLPAGRRTVFQADVLEIELVVTKGETPGRVTVKGRLSVQEIPTLQAYLLVGSDIYHTDLIDGELCFGDVMIGTRVKRIGLIVETP
jgi:hypothetical protein